jgi:D-3-phosphoglycerate dehydrogenase
MKHQCLFSAPFSFMPEIKERYNEVVPTIFREIWTEDDVAADSSVTAWVMNPGQGFIINESVLKLFPNLKLLVTPSTGRNHIDSQAAQKRGIPLYSLLDDREGLNRISASAEFTFLLLLNALRRLDRGIGEVSAMRWRLREDELRGLELSDKRVGLVGFGRIGQRMARYCAAFDASVHYYDPYVENNQFQRSTLEAIFSDSDIVCVCCALTHETVGMIDKTLMGLLKSGATLVNTSRGEIINETDLIETIRKRPDLRVALDVLTGEVKGTQNTSPLMDFHDLGHIVVTPHIAGATFESQTKAALIALNLLKRHL